MSSSCLMDAIVFDVLIQAMEDTQVVTLPVTALSALSQRHPEVELFLYKTASERFSDIMWTMQRNPVHGDGPAGRHLPLGRVHPPGARPLHDP